MNSPSTSSKRSAEPRDLDSSPVFFTGLSNKRAKTESTTRLCRFCNGNLYDNHSGDLCSDCSAIPKDISEHMNQKNSDQTFLNCPTANQNSSNNNLPSCSNNAYISPTNKV